MDELQVSNEEREIIKEVLNKLEGDPYMRGTRWLRGYSLARRARSNGYRIIYRVYDIKRIVIVMRIAHRSVAYEGFTKDSRKYRSILPELEDIRVWVNEESKHREVGLEVVEGP